MSFTNLSPIFALGLCLKYWIEFCPTLARVLGRHPPWIFGVWSIQALNSSAFQEEGTDIIPYQTHTRALSTASSGVVQHTHLYIFYVALCFCECTFIAALLPAVSMAMSGLRAAEV